MDRTPDATGDDLRTARTDRAARGGRGGSPSRARDPELRSPQLDLSDAEVVRELATTGRELDG